MPTRRRFLESLAAGGLLGAAPSLPARAAVATASPSLPQHDPQPYLRALRVAFERSHYRYNHDYLPPVALVDRVPASHQPSLAWLAQVLARLINIGLNARLVTGAPAAAARAGALRDALAGDARVAVRMRETLSRAAAGAAEVAGLGDYAALFRAIPLPSIASQYQRDDVFAWLRVAGPNPVMLRRVDCPPPNFPVTEAVYRSVLPHDGLARAGAEGRLYLADYALLDGVETGFVDGLPKFLAAPLALFAVDVRTRKLLPVAIQCGQSPGFDVPLFTPRDGHGWLVAKTIVSTADANVHEAMTHLARTHLMLEPFVMATERQLAPNHPIGLLLRPHFEGTLFINDLAQSFLLAPDGPVDRLLSGTIEASLGLAAQALRARTLRAGALPRELASRGVDDAGALPDYPYRDDALPYWEAVRRWVDDYVRAYYRSSRDVADDYELAAWWVEIGDDDGGRLPGFEADDVVRTRHELVEILAAIVFTASVQHAAVNYPQFDHMAYAPAMPLASFAPPPAARDGLDEDDLLDLLPPLGSALEQLDILYLLGSVHHTRLGDYPADTLDDPRIQAPLAAFRHRLGEIDSIIAQRNRRRRPYPFLRAAGIPRSTNI